MILKNTISPLLLIALFICLSSCIDRDKYAPKPYVRGLEIVKISDASYLHLSYLKDGHGGYIPCNGYIYMDGEEAIVFDTPINDTLSHQLITFVKEELGVDVKGVVINHSHKDASGGLVAFANANIPSYASTKTAEILFAKDSIAITHTFEDAQEIKIGTSIIHNRYLGEAHSLGNIVSYIPSEKTLFGGCMIKALEATKGNVSDANETSWSQTVAEIKNTFPETEVVIPGHGGRGGTGLLDYTIRLFISDTAETESLSNLD